MTFITGIRSPVSIPVRQRTVGDQQVEKQLVHRAMTITRVVMVIGFLSACLRRSIRRSIGIEVIGKKRLILVLDEHVPPMTISSRYQTRRQMGDVIVVNQLVISIAEIDAGNAGVIHPEPQSA